MYQWDGSSWNQLRQDIDGESYYDNSGWSVSLTSKNGIVKSNTIPFCPARLAILSPIMGILSSLILTYIISLLKF